jgi:uncharacterized lipoprotein YehR (DUF1307 family)
MKGFGWMKRILIVVLTTALTGCGPDEDQNKLKAALSGRRVM